jgi:FtsH-binding integral membrane protein
MFQHRGVFLYYIAKRFTIKGLSDKTKMIKGILSALSMVGCLSTIALGFISPRYALAYSCGSLLLFVVAIALEL